MPDPLVVLRSVEMLEREPNGFVVRIGDRAVHLAPLERQAGSTVWKRGDLGTLVLTRADAERLGVLDLATPASS